MTEIEITNPELIQFINDQIAQGNFATPEEVVNAALQSRIAAETSLTDEDVQAIKTSDEQFARGEGILNEKVKAHFDALKNRIKQNKQNPK